MRHRSVWNVVANILGALTAYTLKPQKPHFAFECCSSGFLTSALSRIDVKLGHFHFTHTQVLCGVGAFLGQSKEYFPLFLSAVKARGGAGSLALYLSPSTQLQQLEHGAREPLHHPLIIDRGWHNRAYPIRVKMSR